MGIRTCSAFVGEPPFSIQRKFFERNKRHIFNQTAHAAAYVVFDSGKAWVFFGVRIFRQPVEVRENLYVSSRVASDNNILSRLNAFIEKEMVVELPVGDGDHPDSRGGLGDMLKVAGEHMLVIAFKQGWILF